ncbi:MAG: AAA family ATPase [Psychrobium sp.]
MTATLYFLCGKMGAGKSTQAKELASEHNAILISEDDWLAAHYPEKIHSFDDYIRYSAQIKPFIKQHVQQLLAKGLSVVMDFPANMIRQRLWFTTLSQEVGCQHQLIYLDVSDEVCLRQIAKRRIEQPARAKFDTLEVFHQVNQYFEPPSAGETLNIINFVSK